MISMTVTLREEGDGDQALDTKEVCGVVNLRKTVGHRAWFAKSTYDQCPSFFYCNRVTISYNRRFYQIVLIFICLSHFLSNCPHNLSWFSFVYPTFCQIVHTICLDFHLFIPLFGAAIFYSTAPTILLQHCGSSQSSTGKCKIIWNIIID